MQNLVGADADPYLRDLEVNLEKDVKPLDSGIISALVPGSAQDILIPPEIKPQAPVMATEEPVTQTTDLESQSKPESQKQRPRLKRKKHGIYSL